MSDYLKSILFLDIETVSEEAEFSELSEQRQARWADQVKQSYMERKFSDFLSERSPTPAELELTYKNRAAIHAEFGKIICIGVGYMSFADDGEPTLRVKTITQAAGCDSDDEYSILQSFAKISEKFTIFCAHNGKKFDYPYIARRMLINGMKVPAILDSRDKKPWEINHIDTQEMWRFGDMSYPSLELLADVLGVSFSKSIEGKDIGNVYRSGKISEIADYCARDVAALAKVFVKLKNPAMNLSKVLFV